MKNFTGIGNRVTLVAAAVTTSGQAVLIGSLFGISESASAIGGQLVFAMNGIFDLTKIASQAWTDLRGRPKAAAGADRDRLVGKTTAVMSPCELRQNRGYSVL